MYYPWLSKTQMIPLYKSFKQHKESCGLWSQVFLACRFNIASWYCSFWLHLLKDVNSSSCPIKHQSLVEVNPTSKPSKLHSTALSNLDVYYKICHSCARLHFERVRFVQFSRHEIARGILLLAKNISWVLWISNEYMSISDFNFSACETARVKKGIQVQSRKETSVWCQIPYFYSRGLACWIIPNISECFTRKPSLLPVKALCFLFASMMYAEMYSESEHS